MGVVKEFGRGLLGPVGAVAGNVETFIEVPFTAADGKKVIPDETLTAVRRGQRSWTALIEVKTGKNELETTQLENYLDVARAEGFDALITISNEIPAVAGQHPTKVDKRKLKKVALHHWSWTYILSTAVMQKEHRGVTDPEQAWILGELIRYLEHPRSGAMELDDMGSSWVPVRQAVSAGTLRANDSQLPEVVARFDAMLRYAALRLGRQLGIDVVHVLSRKEQSDPSLRAAALTSSIVEAGLLSGTIRIPHTVAPIQVCTDLRSGRVTASLDIEAPKEGRPATRINWLVRQLKHAPDTLRVEVFTVGGRGPGETELLGKVREDPTCLVVDPEAGASWLPDRDQAPMGNKRGRGKGAFIDSVLDVVDDFYVDVVQHLKARTASPPRMREISPEETANPSPLSSTALSSQDGAEPT